MSTPKPDLRAQWVPEFSPSSSPPKAKGLIDQLLDEGRIVKEFNMPDATYRVATNFHFDQGSCFFRCAVLRDSIELDTAAWSPVFRNMNELVAGREGDPEAKLQVAQVALEHHLGLCSRVGRRLEEKGTLTQSGRRILFAGAGVLIFVVGVALAAWFGIDKYRARAGEEIGPPLGTGDTSPPPDTTPTPDTAPTPGSAPTPDTGFAPEPVPVTETVTDIETGAEADSVSRSQSGPEEVVSPGTPSPPPQTKPLQTSPRAAELAKPLPPPPVEPAVTPELEPEPRMERPSMTARASPPPPHITAHVTGIGPGESRIVSLSLGEELFAGSQARVSEVPKFLHDVSCATTKSYDGREVSHLSVRVATPARVFIAHDRRVKRKPDWLDSFRSTGETLTASETGSKDVVFDIFRRDFDSGLITLGSNTQTSKVTRKLRELGFKRQAMYLVCVVPRI